jgi:peroxidase
LDCANPSVSTQITQEFSTAAFRVGHSQVSDSQARIDNNGNVIFTQSLTDSFANTPLQTAANDGINALVRNLSSEFTQATDVYAVNGLRNLLATSPDQMDLIAIDIQRERDLGISSLNDTRSALGLTPFTSFAQLTTDPSVQANLQATFGSIDKVDLFVGGIAETHAPGADVGSWPSTATVSL